MIEQIINWWNGLSVLQSIGIFILVGFIVFVVIWYFDEVRPDLKNKRKTITQKYNEGLIKK